MDGVPGAWITNTERVPGYPVFLSAIKSGIANTVLEVISVQALVDSATVVLITVLSSLLGRTTGLVSGVLAALWPNMVINSSLILTDSLFLFFFTACLFACTQHLKKPQLSSAAMIGILLGLSLAVCPVVQFLPPVFLLAILIIVDSGTRSPWNLIFRRTYFPCRDSRTRLATIVAAYLPSAGICPVDDSRRPLNQYAVDRHGIGPCPVPLQNKKP